MSDIIMKCGGIKLPEGMEFDGRNCIVDPSPFPGWFSADESSIDAFEIDTETFNDTGNLHEFHKKVPVIILGRQPGFTRMYSICITPDVMGGVFSHGDYYLIQMEHFAAHKWFYVTMVYLEILHILRAIKSCCITVIQSSSCRSSLNLIPSTLF